MDPSGRIPPVSFEPCKPSVPRRGASGPGTPWPWCRRPSTTVREGSAHGPLIGGCLETICWHLKGSSEWLDLSECILFLETSEEAPGPDAVDAYLTDLERLGVFDDISGLLMGRPAFYEREDVGVLWEVVAQRTAAARIPVLANLDFGHTDPLLTLPMGADAYLDAGAQMLRIGRHQD